MSTNGLNTSEDTEMADCDGEKVVTMMDVLQEQQDFEEDANAVLGASDDKDCTYSKGYIKRQAIYACLTCCSDAKTDATKRAGVCLACSLSCHENHELIELYTKRNFRCDCGNPKFNSHPCQFNPNKTDINEDNKYNQNYSGIYCICHRPYPDPESTIEDEMIQCIICEDWLHASHLDAVVPPNDQYSEMVCKGCMEKNEFLHDYTNFAVTGENVDVDITNINDVTTSNGHASDSVLETSKENVEQDMSVDDVEVEDTTKNNTENLMTNNGGNTENSCEKQTTLETVSEQDMSGDDVKVEDNTTKDNTEDLITPTKCENTENSCENQTTLEIVSEQDMSGDDVKVEDDTTKNNTEDPMTTTKCENIENSGKNQTTSESVSEQDISGDNLKVKDDNTENNTDNPMKTTKCGDTENSCEKETTLETISEQDMSGDDGKVEDDTTKNNTEDPMKKKSTKSGNTENSSENQTTLENVSDTVAITKEEMKEKDETQSLDENKILEDDKQTDTPNQGSIISTQEVPDKINSHNESGPSAENKTDEPSSNIIAVSTSESGYQEGLKKTEEEKDLNNEEATMTGQNMKDDKDNTNVETSSDKQPDTTKSENSDSNTGTDISENVIANDTEEAKLQDTGPENLELLDELHKVDTNTLDITNCANDSNIENESHNIDNITEGNEMHKEKETVNKNEVPHVDVDRQGHSSTENKVPNETTPNTNNKRKLSMDEVKDNVDTKKVKVDEEKTCIRPKGEKRHFKGATFWPSNFRQKLCMCNECLSMYKDLSVLFLIDPEDTVSAYEMLGKEKTEGSPSSQYEKGLQALSSLDRIQQINALTEYNKMRDKLLDFLKSFKDRREIVKEEDIKGFFAGMKPKREPDGVYFCR